MSAHTKGPWQVFCRSSDGEPKRDDFLGYDIEGPPQAQRGQFARRADAYMAAAAPDLYDACKAVVEGYEQATWGGDFESFTDVALRMAKIAIGKAEGA